MSDLPILQASYKGKSFLLPYEPRYKKLAKQRLDEAVEQYKELLRIANLGLDKYLEEMYHNFKARCPNCHSVDTVERRDRVVPYQSIGRIGQLVNGIWHVDPYRRCNACGNDFEIARASIDDLRESARRKYDYAVKETTKPKEVMWNN